MRYCFERGQRRLPRVRLGDALRPTYQPAHELNEWRRQQAFDRVTLTAVVGQVFRVRGPLYLERLDFERELDDFGAEHFVALGFVVKAIC